MCDHSGNMFEIPVFWWIRLKVCSPKSASLEAKRANQAPRTLVILALPKKALAKDPAKAVEVLDTVGQDHQSSPLRPALMGETLITWCRRARGLRIRTRLRQVGLNGMSTC